MQSSFTETKQLESEFVAVIRPSLDQWFGSNWILLTHRDRDGLYLIQKFGDIVGRHKRTGVTTWVELKAEERFTGNIFFETMSNAISDPPRDGWGFTSKADILVYGFLTDDENRKALVIDMPQLQEWALRMYANYREVKQMKHSQHNETWGRIFPIRDIAACVKQEIRLEYPADLNRE